jgi:RNA polymerase sigma-70 factor (ECF subfamily)
MKSLAGDSRQLMKPTTSDGTPDGTGTAEQQLIQDEDAALIRRDVLALFDDDLQARDMVEGIMEGMTVDELRELTGLDKTAYNSKRRLIRRRIDKAYPDEWKS